MNYLSIAEVSAREAGEILRENIGKIKEIEYKTKNSLVTEADRLSESLIVKTIKSNFPSHGILAEERGESGGASAYVWIIDPLDGTTNYAHTYPVFSISIALEVEGIIRLGVVYDPIREELFSAELGNGAYMNGGNIGISKVRAVRESLLCTGFTHESEWMVNENLRHFENFIRNAQAIRRDGSAALDLCYVACGRYDGFWELGLHPWDTAAGALILEESCGKITDFSGGKFDIYGKETLATNGLIHDEMIDVISLEREKQV